MSPRLHSCKKLIYTSLKYQFREKVETVLQYGDTFDVVFLENNCHRDIGNLQSVLSKKLQLCFVETKIFLSV